MAAFPAARMERPALQRLLADIGQGLVDVVVVYKVDRLTRSLADFAKIVEIFDAHGVSFVAVTQQFNTTTSMGRLTLNVLLSFAQFEREVTGERIRDKIAASKRKGMWMGGTVPLGYDVRDRKLVVNRGRGGDRSLDLSALSGARLRATAAGGPRTAGHSFESPDLRQRACGRADAAYCPRCALCPARQSALHRRDPAQGRPLSRASTRRSSTGSCGMRSSGSCATRAPGRAARPTAQHRRR